MNLDDQICYCYHVSLRKLVNFARREKLSRPSQMSNCLGAGTGCGWCIPILVKIYEKEIAGASHAPGPLSTEQDQVMIDGLPDSADAYAESRKDYLRSDDKNTF